jgi:Ca2+-binding EF-hand superfamily protein
MKEYTDEEIETLRIVFDMFDRDKTGTIDIRDLKDIATSLNKNT